jgi:hypothetical protein
MDLYANKRKEKKSKMDEKEKILNDKQVDVNSIVDDLRRQGYKNDEIIAELRRKVENKEITEEDFKKVVDGLEAKEKEEAEKLFDMKLL